MVRALKRAPHAVGDITCAYFVRVCEACNSRAPRCVAQFFLACPWHLTEGCAWIGADVLTNAPVLGSGSYQLVLVLVFIWWKDSGVDLKGPHGG